MRPRWAKWVCAWSLMAAIGCGDEEVAVQQGLGGGSKNADDDTAEAEADAAAVVEFKYSDEDFVEHDTHNRDPFRSYASAFRVQAAAPAQRHVLMAQSTLDEMKLIAIVTNMAQPRAMLVDPSRVGHVVKAGDYIGRPEVVRTGGDEGMPVTLNWRVDRVRPGSVVLTREDPSAPDRPPLTRELALHERQRSR